MSALRDQFDEMQQHLREGQERLEAQDQRIAELGQPAQPVHAGAAAGPPGPPGPGPVGTYTSHMPQGPIIPVIINRAAAPPKLPEKPDLMQALESKSKAKFKKATKRRKKRQLGLGKLYAEARRESVAARRKEKADLTALAKEKVRKVPRKQRKALREKLLNEIKARHKLFRETFPTYRKLKSKSYDVVKRLIENLKTWRLGLKE